MKDIKAILAEHELSDEVRKAIEAAVNENYRTKTEADEKAARIKALKEQNEALTAKAEALEGDGAQLEELRKQVADFKAAEEQRAADAEEAARRESFRVVFDAALGERAFANDLMRETVFEKVYAACQGEAGKGAKDALEDVTRDVEGVWLNPQTDVWKMPSGGDLSQSSESVRRKQEDSKRIADFLLGRLK